MGVLSEEEGLEALRAALDCGMNFIDTAEGYGPGELGGQRYREDSPFKGDGFARVLEVAGRLQEWAQDRGRTLGQLATAWALAHPSVTAATVGPKYPRQVLEAAQAADWVLSADELRERATVKGGFELIGSEGHEMP